MAGSPKCPECGARLESVGNAWRCTDCHEYFSAYELPEPERPHRDKRPWSDDDDG